MFFIYLCSILSVILIAEKSGKIFYFGYVFKASLIILFLISFYLNRDLFKNIKNKYLKYFFLFFLSSLMTLLLGYLVLIIAINFNLSMGGKI